MRTPQHLKHIPEGPIREFVAIIEDLPVDEWNKRSKALQHIVSLIPEGSSYAEVSAWYNSPPILRHMSRAVSELLKDPRSTVVKRTCASMTQLFNKCQSDARYLFKDIMPTILSVHAQTVQVIRQAVQGMVLETIPEVPCKMVMPLWMERLKVDKSRTVRDACALYLGQALQSWGTLEGYLTEEIWLQVGTTLVKSIRDPSPNVRTHARETLEEIMHSQPGHWETLVTDPDGPAARDPKLKRWLRNLATSGYQGNASAEQEELSVASKFSYNSDSRFRPSSNSTAGGGGATPTAAYRMGSPARNNTAAPSPSYQYLYTNRGGGGGGGGGFRGGGAGANENEHNDLDVDAVIPTSIAVKTPAPGGGSSRTSKQPQQQQQLPPTRGLGPPLRPKPFQQTSTTTTTTTTSMESSALSGKSSVPSNGGTPPRPPSALQAQPQSQQQPTNLRSVIPTDSALEPIQDNSASSLHEVDFPPKLQQQQQPPRRLAPPATATKPPAEQPASAPVVAPKPKPTSTSTSLTTRALERVAELRLSKSMEKEAQQIQQQADLETKSSVDSSTSSAAAAAAAAAAATGPFLLNMQKLKESASRRRNRNSLLMQERLRMSSSNLAARGGEHPTGGGGGGDKDNGDEKVVSKRRSGEENEAPADDNAGGGARPVVVVPSPSMGTTASTTTAGSSPVAGPPEHMVIAIRLLRDHKLHVDRIMETLKMEMDALRDFDSLLELAGRPTEAEVLDYFESVGLCLDQRLQSSLQLQAELDRISRGEPSLTTTPTSKDPAAP